MKKWMIGWVAMLLALGLAGCGAEETFETISDVYGNADPADHRAVVLKLPEGAAAPVMDGEGGQLYLCGDYEIAVQTLSGGDLQRTVQTVSGYSMDTLTVMETAQGSWKRYDFTWTAAGEGNDQIVRAAVLDDGNYHYVLTAQTDALNAGALRQTWNAIFASFDLS